MDKNYRAELTGVFGDPVDGNPTGVMEEAGYEALGLNFRYITMKVTRDDFPDAMRAVRALHMRGVVVKCVRASDGLGRCAVLALAVSFPRQALEVCLVCHFAPLLRLSCPP